MRMHIDDEEDIAYYCSRGHFYISIPLFPEATFSKSAPEILRCAQDDTLHAVILSAAKDLWRIYG
jgi:hypothetical protein